MKKFKKLFASLAIVAMLASVVPTAVLGTTTYSAELTEAYGYAYENGITTMSSIENADMLGALTRVAMAKMMANYAIETLGLTPDTDKDCTFPDVSAALDLQYDNGVTKACQLGLMGVGIDNFNPMGLVTRAEFGTVLSRALWGDEYNVDTTPYYAEHLQALNDADIMNNISNPSMREVRGYVMLMMMRADESTTPAICELPENIIFCSVDSDECPTQCRDVVVYQGDLTVALSSETPTAADIPGNVAGLPTVKFTLQAGNEDVMVNGVTVKRTGLSDSNTLTALALFGPTGRISADKNENTTTDEASLNITNGYLLKANEKVTFTVVADVANAAAAGGDKFAVEVKDIATNADVTGLPVRGNTFTVGNVDAATLTIDTNGSVTNPKVGDDAVDLFKFKAVGSSLNDIEFNSITFKENGDVDQETELGNFKLYNDTTLVASVASMNGKYLTFTFADPITVEKGKTEKFTVKGDVLGGPAKHIVFYVDKTLDVSATDTRYDFGSAVDITAVDAANDLGNLVIQAGTLTLVDTDATITKIKENKTDVILGSLSVTSAAGKDLELQKFGFEMVIAGCALNANSIFENVELYDAKYGVTYELTNAGANDQDVVYADDDLNIPLAAGTHNFILRADTIDPIAAFDTCTMTPSLEAGDTNIATKGAFYVLETAEDTVVTDITPSSLSWKKLEGSEAGATAAKTAISNINVVRGAKNQVAMQFTIKADASSALIMSEIKTRFEANGASATNQEIAQAKLYKDSVTGTNLLDTVAGSNLAAGIATFDGFTTPIAASETKTFYVVIDVVDGADAVTNSPITTYLYGATLEDSENSDVYLAADTDANGLLNELGGGKGLSSGRSIAVTNAGNLTVTSDANNTDNVDNKTILAGTVGSDIYSADVQATNENADVEEVIFTVDTDLTSAVQNASLYLGTELIATNTNADITATTITFDNLSTLIIPQETKELKLKLNTATIGYEKVGTAITNAKVTKVDLKTIEGVDSGKTIADKSLTWSGKGFTITPVVLTASVVTTINGGQGKLTIAMDKGANTVSNSNASPTVLLTDLVFSQLGNTAEATAFKIYKEGQSARFGYITSAGAFTKNTLDDTLDLTISSSATYVIIPLGTAGTTYALNLAKDGIEYTVNDPVTPIVGITTNALTELDLGSKTY